MLLQKHSRKKTSRSSAPGGFEIGKALPEHVGWFIVVGLGAIFAVVISVEIKLEEKYLGVKETSEWFNTAGRTIKTGLTAAAIVSVGLGQLHFYSHLRLHFNME